MAGPLQPHCYSEAQKHGWRGAHHPAPKAGALRTALSELSNFFVRFLGVQPPPGRRPLVVSVLWMALIVRCPWFLRRLRGWRGLDTSILALFLGAVERTLNVMA